VGGEFVLLGCECFTPLSTICLDDCFVKEESKLLFYQKARFEKYCWNPSELSSFTHKEGYDIIFAK